MTRGSGAGTQRKWWLHSNKRGTRYLTGIGRSGATWGKTILFYFECSTSESVWIARLILSGFSRRSCGSESRWHRQSPFLLMAGLRSTNRGTCIRSRNSRKLHGSSFVRAATRHDCQPNLYLRDELGDRDHGSPESIPALVCNSRLHFHDPPSFISQNHPMALTTRPMTVMAFLQH